MSELPSRDTVLWLLSEETNTELADYRFTPPDDRDEPIEEVMKTDPIDGKISFMPIHPQGFKVFSIEASYLLLDAIHGAAILASEDAGHTVYPLYRVKD